MACPECGSASGEFRFVTSVETHGLDCGPYETFNEEFIVCLACGGRSDLREWDGTPKEPSSFHDGGNQPGNGQPYSSAVLQQAGNGGAMDQGRQAGGKDDAAKLRSFRSNEVRLG